ncbi:MAG TPA: hypothetical protein VNL94_01405 [Candidatus Binatia bacterium]|nr:hypothetical protein [Candidatus Binatia bacterium]
MTDPGSSTAPLPAESTGQGVVEPLRVPGGGLDPGAGVVEPLRAPGGGLDPGAGVVEPLRVPGADAATRAWAALPVLAQAFLVAALVDLLARVLGLFGLPPPIDIAEPISLLGYLPHLALVLLPVAVLWRRPDAAQATPLVLWGAVALGLAELLTLPLTLLVPLGADMTLWALVGVLGIAGGTAGYALLALGLADLTQSVPSQVQLGLSNVVLWVIAASAILTTLLGFVVTPVDLGDPGLNTRVQLVNAIGPLPILAAAYLARIVVRGTSDVRRPTAATTTATGAVLLKAFVHVASLVLALVVLIQLAFGLAPGQLGVGSSLVFGLLGGVADILLVAAFALGLADTSVRIPGAGEARHPTDEAVGGREPLRWPAPGGDVPVYRPIERPAAEASPEAEQPAPGRRRGRASDRPTKSNESKEQA